jgi:DNA-binding transcriptional LysR family regulator
VDLLRCLEVFVQTVEAGSLSAAGRALGLSPSAVSKQIAALEEAVGTALLARTTRGLGLTGAGERCLGRAKRLLSDAASLQAEIRDSAGRALKSRLGLTAPPGFGRACLMPIAQSFAAQHPDLHIDLKLANEFVDLVSNQIDVAVRIGILRDSSLIATKIGVVRRLLVASPAYLKNRDAILEPADLVAHNSLRESHLTAESQWLFRHASGAEFKAVTVTGTISSNDTEVLYHAALDGKGVALLPDWYALQGVEEGRLTLLLKDWEADLFVHPRNIYAIFPSAEYIPLNTREFVSFLRREMSLRAAASLRIHE